MTRATRADFARVGRTVPARHITYVAKQKWGRGYHIVGMGGLTWEAGLCFLYLDSVDMKRTHPVHVVRWAKKMLQRAWLLGETQVIAVRDEAPYSAKLLRLLGFELVATLPEHGDAELWLNSRSSPQSPPLPQP